MAYAPTQLRPANGTTILGSTTFSWDTSGVGQTQYEATITDKDTGTIRWLTDGALYSTQQLVTSTTRSLTVTSAQVGVNAFGYLWRVRFNSVEGWSQWSDYQSIFATVTSGTTVLVSPTSSGVNTRNTLVKWLYGGNSPQSSYQIVISTGGLTVYDSGEVGSIANVGDYVSVLVPYPSSDWTTYTLDLYVRDSNATRYGPYSATYQVVAEPLPRPAFSVSESGGVVTINASTTYPDITSFDLSRWSPQRQTYQVIATGLNPTFTYQDYLAPSGVPIWYRLIARSSTTGASDQWQTASITVDQPDWVLATPTSRLVVDVVDVSIGQPVPVQSLEPLGRSRPVVSRFGIQGREGSISVFADVSERDTLLASLHALVGQSPDVYILSPFGDTIRCELTGISTNDEIGGSAVFDLSYVEKAAS